MSTLFLRNASIWTGDRARPRADAACAVDGRFVFVGAERDATAPSAATVLDAGGRLVVPGFVDGHAHMLSTGYAMSSVDLKGVPSVEEAARRVAERARSTPAGGWVRGAGWDQNDWPGARFPDRRALDAAAAEHPVVLTHTSGHCVWVNSAALRAAGIDKGTEAPFGGAIDIDGAGEPTGILRDTAARLVTAAAPAPSPPERVASLEAAIAHAHSLGVTGAHAMDVGRGEYQAMLALRDSGRLRVRLRAFLSAERIDEWFERGVRTGDGTDMMRIGGVKFFADGALGSLTAWMSEPYEKSENTGFPLQPVDVLEERVRRCLAGGLAPAVHAIGDRANREVLNLYERLAGVALELPRRIEHAQLLATDDIARFGALGVTASVQPIHATQDMRKVDREWGARGSGAYAFSSLARSGATLAFGSDTPVETMDPLAGLHAAVTRRNVTGEPPDGWYPDERITLDAALRAYTSGCARAVDEVSHWGRIAEGAYADFVVLSRDILALGDPMQLLDTRADATVVGGDIVYRREEAPLREQARGR
jgi:predicted amidohydrolase YtcJ